MLNFVVCLTGDRPLNSTPGFFGIPLAPFESESLLLILSPFISPKPAAKLESLLIVLTSLCGSTDLAYSFCCCSNPVPVWIPSAICWIFLPLSIGSIICIDPRIFLERLLRKTSVGKLFTKKSSTKHSMLVLWRPSFSCSAALTKVSSSSFFMLFFACGVLFGGCFRTVSFFHYHPNGSLVEASAAYASLWKLDQSKFSGWLSPPRILLF